MKLAQNYKRNGLPQSHKAHITTTYKKTTFVCLCCYAVLLRLSVCWMTIVTPFADTINALIVPLYVHVSEYQYWVACATEPPLSFSNQLTSEFMVVFCVVHNCCLFSGWIPCCYFSVNCELSYPLLFFK
jgi:hypothetical protein